jgi:subtilisin family serine protease
MRLKNFFSFGLAIFMGSSLIAQTFKNPSGQPLFRLPHGMIEDQHYIGKTLIIRVKEQQRGQCTFGHINHTGLNNAFTVLGVTKLEKKFPSVEKPLQERNSAGQKLVDLSLVYELKYTANIGIEKAANLLLSSGILEYAEPHTMEMPDAYTPNDPNNGTQTFLTRIQAYNAWDLGLGGHQGDTSVVIAIVDSGSDMDHPDLVTQFKKNYADPIGGGDDDGDGFVDNFNGWDLAGNDYNNVVGDNDPTIMGNNNNHGSHVSGCASAATDNGVGVSGPGFKCRLLAVKCAADNDTRGTGGVGYIITGYEGIQYAADHGAKVINCSFGSNFGGFSFHQSIIDYATINKGALVVAAAGNTSLDEVHYPASYNYAFSVAATNQTNDQKASFSTFHYSVDISTPGNGIYTTLYNNTYSSMSGTSMASPITAGGAGLVLSKFPTYNGMQAGMRLKTTADNHYSVNGSYQYKLGSGRLNLYRALTDPNGPGVVFSNEAVTDNNDNAFSVGDTLFISGDFTNYLAPTSALSTTLTCIVGAANLTTLDNTESIGVVNTLQTVNNAGAPYRFKINAGTPLNTSLTFRLTMNDGAFTAYYHFTVIVNPDYVNITVNDVFTTITSKGKIGWNQDGAVQGLGFNYQGMQLLYEGALMVGTSATAVSDAFRGSTGTTADADFAALINAYEVVPSVKSNFDVAGRINDNPASPVQNLRINHNAYAWTSTGNRKYVIVEYFIRNNGSSALNNLFAGIAADWDIDAATYANNKSDYDPSKMMGYSWCTNTAGKYAGIKLLTNTAPPVFYAIDNVTGGGGGIDVNDAGNYFSTSDKYTALSTNRLQGGNTAGTGNDVMNVMSTGPYNINAGDSVVVAFALIAGDDLIDIQKSADSAQVHYNGTTTTGIANIASAEIFSVYPNPNSGHSSLMLNAEAGNSYTIEIYNAIGEMVYNDTYSQLPAGTSKINLDLTHLNNGSYFIQLKSANKLYRSKMVIQK